MKRALLAGIFCCLSSLAFAQDIRVSPPNNGQYPGVTSNTAANAGNIGEYISNTVASGSAISLTNATPVNLTSISLTAGDWECTSVAYFVPAATTIISVGISSTSTTTAVLDTSVFRAGDISAPTATGGNTISAISGPSRFSLSATTTVFQVLQGNFNTSTLTAYGGIQCWRTH
jgi:hypothetical protein